MQSAGCVPWHSALNRDMQLLMPRHTMTVIDDAGAFQSQCNGISKSVVSGGPLGNGTARAHAWSFLFPRKNKAHFAE